MSLINTAISDLNNILLDESTGFSSDITLTDPSGNIIEAKGLSQQIGVHYDAEQGVMVSGDQATVSIPFSFFVGGVLPKSVEYESSKPWVVSFINAYGVAGSYRVVSASNDNMLGLSLLTLEKYINVA